MGGYARDQSLRRGAVAGRPVRAGHRAMTTAPSLHWSRRGFLASVSALAIVAPLLPGRAFAAGRTSASPVHAKFVTLRPSPFADARAANRRYLLSLDPER